MCLRVLYLVLCVFTYFHMFVIMLPGFEFGFMCVVFVPHYVSYRYTSTLLFRPYDIWSLMCCIMVLKAWYGLLANHSGRVSGYLNFGVFVGVCWWGLSCLGGGVVSCVFRSFTLVYKLACMSGVSQNNHPPTPIHPTQTQPWNHWCRMQDNVVCETSLDMVRISFFCCWWCLDGFNR